ncbi:MAG: type II toxin-antitoxin system HicB family antitoxin [Deltaproteobacteria bacterium]|nr:type II toxin-antitoxin system HicB family antitoxin [Deltaproteobacteria bacterium]
MSKYKLTALIEPEGAGYLARCPELHISSQGDSLDQARENLQEAVKSFLDAASSEEIARRLGRETNVVRAEEAVD